MAVDVPAKKSRRTVFGAVKEVTGLVVDDADFDVTGIVDATTNPSLIHKLLSSGSKGDEILEAAIKACGSDAPANDILDYINVMVAKKVLEKVPGIVSLEVDPKLSFDGEESYKRAIKLLELCKSQGIDTDRIAIKLPATWAGIEACKRLADEKYKVNLTLIFSLVQAIAGTANGAHLLSPFVGRITDYYKSQNPQKDPGVEFVKQVYTYVRGKKLNATVMGASFRSMKQVQDLCGCDKLTVPPNILKEMMDTGEEGTVEPALTPAKAEEDIKTMKLPKGIVDGVAITDKIFWECLFKDTMAVHLLSEGILKFEVAWEEAVKLIEKKRTV